MKTISKLTDPELIEEAREINIYHSDNPYYQTEVLKELLNRFSSMIPISVKERLPEIGSRVLTIDATDGQIHIGNYDKRDPYGRQIDEPMFCDEQDEQPGPLFPTHWISIEIFKQNKTTL